MNRPTSPADGRFRVLVVSDDPNAPHALLGPLAQVGLDCRYSPDTADDLAALPHIDPHLVLLDFSSLAATRSIIARLQTRPAVPAVLATLPPGQADEQTGADAVLPKPLGEHDLVKHTIAVLKRVYGRVDLLELSEEAGTLEQAAGAATIAPGMAFCEACDYSGPMGEFEKIDSQGNTALLCPRCGDMDRVSFGVG